MCTFSPTTSTRLLSSPVASSVDWRPFQHVRVYFHKRCTFIKTSSLERHCIDTSLKYETLIASIEKRPDFISVLWGYTFLFNVRIKTWYADLLLHACLCVDISGHATLPDCTDRQEFRRMRFFYGLGQHYYYYLKTLHHHSPSCY